MKEYPILFSAEMVRAILEGRKTQTRRALKKQPPASTKRRPVNISGPDHDGLWSYTVDPVAYLFACPYGVPGDRLWVRETWGEEISALVRDAIGRKDASDLHIFYGADKCGWGGPWFPSIHMPRWASRILLEVVSVRVERLQDITEEEAQAEGVNFSFDVLRPGTPYRRPFIQLWDKINAKRGHGWNTNPWVWVIEFKVLPAEGALGFFKPQFGSPEKTWETHGCSTPGCGYPDGKRCIRCGLIIQPRKEGA